MTRDAEEGAPRLVPLEWDSQHFGWPIARLDGPHLREHELTTALAAARASGSRLVYWFADPECAASERLLREYSGRLVDHRVTFRRETTPATGAKPVPTPEGMSLQVWPVGEPSPELVALAVTAGGHSRFARDPRIPAERFRALYETWIRRSTHHEMAERVYVMANPRDDLLGFITVGMREAEGSRIFDSRDVGLIGLVAVAEQARGRGIGHCLLQAACNWVEQAGGGAVEVATQGDNGPAMALYRRAGFQPVAMSHVYHFWLDGPLGLDGTFQRDGRESSRDRIDERQ